jgi:predicted RNA-binding Zn-ribbon protein involved in translation (DUF1610 family)
MSPDELKARIHQEVDQLGMRGLATVLAALVKICPRCQEVAIKRSSWAVGSAQYVRLLCRKCGWVGTKSVRVHNQELSEPTGEGE